VCAGGVCGCVWGFGGCVGVFVCVCALQNGIQFSKHCLNFV
jgi:hypothetical protein